MRKKITVKTENDAVEKAGSDNEALRETPNEDKSNNDLNKPTRRMKAFTEDDIAFLRDTQDNYKILERKFGTLIPGQSFGESFMLGASANNRFFNAIALTDCILLTLTKKDYDNAL